MRLLLFTGLYCQVASATGLEETASRLQRAAIAAPADTDGILANLAPQDWMDALTLAAARLRDAGQLDAAHGMVARARDHMGTDPDRMSGIARLTGLLHQAEGAYGPARDAFARGLEIRLAHLPADHPKVLQVRTELAVADIQVGRVDAARQGLEEVLAILERQQPRPAAQLGRVCDQLAGLHFRVGDLAGAEDLARRAVALYSETEPGSAAHGQAATNLAVVLAARWDFDAAAATLAEALALLEGALGPDHDHVAAALKVGSRFALQRRDWSDARRMATRAVAIQEARFGPDHPMTATSLAELAEVHLTAGDADLAVSLSSRAVHAAGPEHPRRYQLLVSRARAHTTAGDAAAALSDWEEAIEAFVGYYDAADPKLGFLLADSAKTLEALGRTAEARQRLERARTLLEAAPELEVELTWTLEALAEHLARAGDLDSAMALSKRTLEIRRARLGPDHVDTRGAQARHAEILALAGRVEEAAALSRAVRAWVEVQGPWLLRSVSEHEALALADTLRAMLSFALSAEFDPREAWHGVLVGRGIATRTLAERMRERRGDDPAQWEALTEARRDLAKASLQRGATSDPARIEALLARKDALERALTGQPGPVAGASPTQICAAIPRRSVLLDFAVMSATQTVDTPQLVGFAVHPGCEVTRVVLGPQEAIDDAATRYRSLLDQRAVPVRLRPPGEALRVQLLDSLLPEREGVDHLFVVADASLATLPWAALPVGSEEWLVERVAVSLLDHPQDLVRPARSAGTGALVVGGIGSPGDSAELRVPACGEVPTAALPGASVEASRVAKALRRGIAGPVEQLGGEEATVANVAREAVGRRFLHLATHGFFARDCGPVSPAAPMVRSGLVLSPEPGEASVLTAEAVAGLDLGGVELVVLSACDTGLGEHAIGEGVLGLRRALTQAGVRQQIMSLWAVEDEATRILMEDLYSGLLRRRHPLPPHLALREAQLGLLERGRRTDGDDGPYRWGGFVSLGVAAP